MVLSLFRQMSNKDLTSTQEIGLKPNIKQALIHECEILYQTKGLLKPQDLVISASNPDSPLHEVFEWDNEIAAEKFRLAQARQLIHLVKVETSSGDELPKYVNVKFEEKGVKQQGYMPISAAMKQETLKEQILKSALAEARYWELKYKNYEELAGVVNEEKLAEVEAQIS